MKQNAKMAKVITMKTKVNDNLFMNMVTTVDPIVTPEMAQLMYGVPGHIVKSEESNEMPLPFALDYARRQRAKLGIKNCVSFMNNHAA